MVRKIFFPRLFIPAADSMSGILDFCISLVLLLGLMLWYKVAFNWQLLLIPAFSLLAQLAEDRPFGSALQWQVLMVHSRSPFLWDSME